MENRRLVLRRGRIRRRTVFVPSCICRLREWPHNLNCKSIFEILWWLVFIEMWYVFSHTNVTFGTLQMVNETSVMLREFLKETNLSPCKQTSHFILLCLQSGLTNFAVFKLAIISYLPKFKTPISMLQNFKTLIYLFRIWWLNRIWEFHIISKLF